MNRIYQGRVRKVELLDSKSNPIKPPPDWNWETALWNHGRGEIVRRQPIWFAAAHNGWFSRRAFRRRFMPKTVQPRNP